MTPSDYIAIDGVQKAYGAELVISHISLTISKGMFVSLWGPNGCGKTTLLKLLTGIDCEYQGIIRIGGKLPEQISVGIVPQNSEDALLPWRNVLENIALPLEACGFNRDERAKAVPEFIKEVGVGLPLEKYPYQLSGGQKQVVAVVRALIGGPDLLVLDEPFASLDFRHMIAVQDALRRLWQFTKTTTVLVTHDLLGAIHLANRVFVLSPRPMRVITVKDINLSHPISRQDSKLISLMNELQRTSIEWANGT
jgi:NitT/TauT family transport system ATP-binding protein